MAIDDAADIRGHAKSGHDSRELHLTVTNAIQRHQGTCAQCRHIDTLPTTPGAFPLVRSPHLRGKEADRKRTVGQGLPTTGRDPYKVTNVARGLRGHSAFRGGHT